MKRVHNTEEFIAKSLILYGDLYDYSRVVYVKSKQKVEIICRKHGSFFIRPNDFLNGHGCPQCYNEQRGLKQRKSLDKFIKQSVEIHGNKYDYSKVNYINNKTKVCIICPEHGEFWQIPEDHLKGHGCKKCADVKSALQKSEFIEKARKIHGDLYDYSDVVYVNSYTPVKIKCEKHGFFYQKPTIHLSGCMCPKCQKNYHLTTDEFILKSQQIHQDKYNYDKTVYKNSYTKVLITCKLHGDFYQTPNVHLSGCGCPKCKTKSQTKLYEKIKSHFPGEQILFEAGCSTVKWLQGQRFDIYFPQYNIAIEYDGQQHYKPIAYFGGEKQFQINKMLDLQKNKKCDENNCTLFRIKYDYSDLDFTNLVNNIKTIINEYHN